MFLSTGVAIAQEVVGSELIDSDRSLYCVTYSDDAGQFTALAVQRDGEFRRQRNRKWNRRYRKMLRKSRRKLRRSCSRGGISLRESVNDEQQVILTNRQQVRACARQQALPSDPDIDGSLATLGCQILQGSESSLFPMERIINGRGCDGETSVLQLSLLRSGFPFSSCSGVSVGGGYVMLAAHCLRNRVDQIQIRRAGVTYTSVALFQHPNFDNAETLEPDDIAIADFGQAIPGPTLPICTDDSLTVGTLGFTAGFGLNDCDRANSTLRVAGVTIQRLGVDSIGATYIPGTTTNGTTCNGDSGGPLVIPDTTTGGATYCVAGATSWGENRTCGLNGRPDNAWWSRFSSASGSSFIAENTTGLLD